MLGEHQKVVAPSEMFLLRYPDYDTWRAEKPVAMESLFEFFDLIGEPKGLGRDRRRLPGALYSRACTAGC